MNKEFPPVEKIEYPKIPESDNNSKILTAKELLEQGAKEIDWVVKSILPKKSIIIIAGSPGSYKSAMALTLALQVGSQKPFLDKFATKKNKTLYVDMEAGITGLSLRLKQLMQGHNINETDTVFMCDEPISLDYPEVAIELLSSIIEEHKIDIIIFDAVVRAMSSEENSASDVRKVFSTLQQLRESHGVTFILIHHLSKGQNNITLNSLRGSGDFGAMADAVWGLTATQKGFITITCLKHRYLPLHDINPINVKVENPDGDLNRIYFNYQGVKEKPLTVDEQARKHILNWTRSNKITEFSPSQAHDAVKNKGCSMHAVKEAINKLKSDGDIFQSKSRQPYQINTNLVEVEDLEY